MTWTKLRKMRHQREMAELNNTTYEVTKLNSIILVRKAIKNQS